MTVHAAPSPPPTPPAAPLAALIPLRPHRPPPPPVQTGRASLPRPVQTGRASLSLLLPFPLSLTLLYAQRVAPYDAIDDESYDDDEQQASGLATPSFALPRTKRTNLVHPPSY